MPAYTQAHHCSSFKTGAVKVKLCAYISINAWYLPQSMYHPHFTHYSKPHSCTSNIHSLLSTCIMMHMQNHGHRTPIDTEHSALAGMI